jgi:hypothetical protein
MDGAPALALLPGWLLAVHRAMTLPAFVITQTIKLYLYITFFKNNYNNNYNKTPAEAGVFH